MRGVLVAAILALTPAPSFAQADARWLPWIGCWQSAVERLAGEEARVCLVPSGAGVKMVTVVGDQMSTDQIIVADSADRPLGEPACSGSSRAEWAQSGALLYTRSSLTCNGSALERVSGLHLITDGPTWVDIQVVEAPSRDSVRTRRYTRMSVPPALSDVLDDALVARAAAAAAHLATTPISIADIIEAQSKVASAGLEGALFETKTRFPLTSRALRSLSAAGVPERVIDLMLAISYPEHFRVSRWADGSQSQGFYGETLWDDWSFSRPLSRTYFFSRFEFYEPPYDYVTVPSPGEPNRGKVVNGQGYTRVQRSDDGSADSPSGSPTGAVKALSEHDDGSRGGSSASSAGYSSGSDGGGSSGGRTAVAR